MKILFLSLILCAGLHAQDATKVSEVKDITVDWAETAKNALAQLAEAQAENARITKLLSWYQQQFMALQAQMIEQQVAPKVPAKPEAKP